jgi:hypothetical protein
MAVIFVLLLLACGTKQPEAERARRSVASWDASLALAASSWTRGELPKHFIRNAAEAAVEELSKEAGGTVPPDVTHASARAIALAHELEEAVEHDDFNAALRVANALEAQSKALQ